VLLILSTEPGRTLLPFTPADARKLSDLLLGRADAVRLTELAENGDEDATELLAELRKQLSEAEPIPPWYEDR
jgi:hypothetical protein